jgi:integrase
VKLFSVGFRIKPRRSNPDEFRFNISGGSVYSGLGPVLPVRQERRLSMKELVRLKTRLPRDGKRFTYRLEYVDDTGKRRRISLGHYDRRKAERQRAQRERELRMGISEPAPMKLGEFWEDCRNRTRGQVRESTITDRDTAMRQLIEVVGDIECEKVQYKHGEQFMQACLDKGNTIATAYKKISAVKRVLQLAVLRDQLEKNPFKHLRRPKIPEQEIHVYDDDECHRLLRVAREGRRVGGLNWELLIAVALCTGMRRGELLNTTWRDVDFARQTIKVSPKKDSQTTWEWHIKDAERRILPLTDEITQLLIRHQDEQPQGCAYVFVPPSRYDRIERRREQGVWTTEDGKCPVNNFKRKFDKILKRGSIDEGEFHDLRRTCMTRWFANGLTEFDVMKLAGHSDFATTHRFYLAVRRDLIEKARVAAAATMTNDFGTRPYFGRKGFDSQCGKMLEYNNL